MGGGGVGVRGGGIHRKRFSRQAPDPRWRPDGREGESDGSGFRRRVGAKDLGEGLEGSESEERWGSRQRRGAGEEDRRARRASRARISGRERRRRQGRSDRHRQSREAMRQTRRLMISRDLLLAKVERRIGGRARAGGRMVQARSRAIRARMIAPKVVGILRMALLLAGWRQVRIRRARVEQPQTE